MASGPGSVLLPKKHLRTKLVSGSNRCERTQVDLAERGIETSVGEREVTGWRALVCLLFSTRILEFLQSPDSVENPIRSNHPKLVASRAKARCSELHKSVFSQRGCRPAPTT